MGKKTREAWAKHRALLREQQNAPIPAENPEWLTTTEDPSVDGVEMEFFGDRIGLRGQAEHLAKAREGILRDMRGKDPQVVLAQMRAHFEARRKAQAHGV